MGAVLSRHFIQYYQEEYSTRYDHYTDAQLKVAVKNRMCALVDKAVLSTGHCTYGSSLYLDMDEDYLYRWRSSDPEHIDMIIRTIFIEGRFAPFNRRNKQEQTRLAQFLSIHPEVVEILRENGYRLNSEMLSRM